MLTKIYIDGFRHFKNFTIEPYEQTTLLCGINGTGKTSIVEVLNRLQLFLANSLPVTSLCSQADLPLWDIKDYGSTSSTFGFDMEISNTSYSYELEVRHNFKESICRVEKESLKVGATKIFSSRGGNAEVFTDDERNFTYPVDWTFSGLLVAERNSSQIRAFLELMKDKLFLVSLNPFAISSAHQESEPILSLDGSNFSAWYDHMANKQIAVVADTFGEINAFIPGFKQFAFEIEGKSKELMADIFIDKATSYRLPFENLSHGQKILCVLHLLLRVCPENATIVIDEFENFLSPVELQPLYDAAQDANEEKNIQFVFVSHHQKTLNWYQDCAYLLSTMGKPAFVRSEKFPVEQGIGIEDYLKAGTVE